MEKKILIHNSFIKTTNFCITNHDKNNMREISAKVFHEDGDTNKL